MKITKDGNKVIMEIEARDFPELSMEVAVDNMYMALQQTEKLFTDPVLWHSITELLLSNPEVEKRVQAHQQNLTEKWELYD